MTDSNYSPKEPYIIQSGKKKGQSLEQLMFSNYGWLSNMLSLLNKEKSAKKNRLHQHLEWVLQKGEKIKPTMLCPQCRKETVTHFSVIHGSGNDISVGSIYSCCDKGKCQNKLDSLAIGNTNLLYPIVFSSIPMMGDKTNQKLTIRAFRDFYELPQRATKQWLFQLFCQ